MAAERQAAAVRPADDDDDTAAAAAEPASALRRSSVCMGAYTVELTACPACDAHGQQLPTQLVRRAWATDKRKCWSVDEAIAYCNRDLCCCKKDDDGIGARLWATVVAGKCPRCGVQWLYPQQQKQRGSGATNAPKTAGPARGIFTAEAAYSRVTCQVHLGACSSSYLVVVRLP